MKNKIWLFWMVLGFWGFALQSSQAQVQVGVGVNLGGGGDSFHLAIGNYYHAPPAQVTIVAQRHIPDEESPVVFFVAGQAHVPPGVIIDLRAGGMPWVEILHRYHLSPRIFYVPVHVSVWNTPYSNFYAYYNERGHHRIRLLDADIINMVNLRFASDYYHRTPEEVIRLRAGGHNYAYIHDQYRHPEPYHPNDRPEDRPEHHFGQHQDDNGYGHRDGGY
jgi:hypothetical protein